MPFEKIETRRKSAYAAEQLINAIKDGAYKVGDRLPPERELAERMGISRPLIREALSALHLAGIIESRAGDGTYIRKSIGNADIETQVLSILEENEDPIEVLEAREALEVGAAKLAARKASAKNLEEIENALMRGKKAGEMRDYDGYVKADRDFHLSIIKASQNTLLEATICPLINIREQELWKQLDQIYLFNDRDINQTLKEHEQIFTAIKQGNGKQASLYMEKHIMQAQKRFISIKHA